MAVKAEWAKWPTGLWAELMERVDHAIKEWKHRRAHPKPTDAELARWAAEAQRSRVLGRD